jgi:hypothetical protein
MRWTTAHRTSHAVDDAWPDHELPNFSNAAVPGSTTRICLDITRQWEIWKLRKARRDSSAGGTGGSRLP